MDGAEKDLAAPEGTITLMLQRMRDGDPDAGDELFAHVEDDLRSLARRALRSGGSPYPSAAATELVNKTCARLLGRASMDLANRRHFFYVFGRAMHDTLVDEARRMTAQKRGGGVPHAPLLSFEVEDRRTMQVDVVALHHALDELREKDPDSAMVVSLLFFSGRTLREAAEILGCSLATVRGHWEYARAWLRTRLEGMP